MNNSHMAASALWSIAIIIGLARLAVTLGRWPRAVSNEENSRAAALSHMEENLLGAAFSAALVTLGVAGILRHAHLAVRIPLWIALIALLAGWLNRDVPAQTISESRQLRMDRFRRCVELATWSTIASAVAFVGFASMHRPYSLWLMVATLSLFYMAARVDLMLRQIARDLRT